MALQYIHKGKHFKNYMLTNRNINIRLEVYSRNKFYEIILNIASYNRQICPVENISQNLKVRFHDLLTDSKPQLGKH